MILYRAMYNVESQHEGLLNLWVREQEHLGAPIREVETVSIGMFPDRLTAEGALADYDPPLIRWMDWRYHPSPLTGWPFWWADLQQVNLNQKTGESS